MCPGYASVPDSRRKPPRPPPRSLRDETTRNRRKRVDFGARSFATKRPKTLDIKATGWSRVDR